MSKIVNTNYEYVQLSDVLQATPWPAGYSPTLPTPSGVTPISTTGITVPYAYVATNTFAVGQSFGYRTTGGTGSVPFLLPAYSNFYVYNPGTVRVCIAPTYWTVATQGSWPVIAVEPGNISTWWQSMQGTYTYTNSPVTNFTAYVCSAAAPATVPSSVTGTISLQIFYWVETNND